MTWDDRAIVCTVFGLAVGEKFLEQTSMTLRMPGYERDRLCTDGYLIVSYTVL